MSLMNDALHAEPAGLSDREFQAIASFMYKETGIVLSEAKRAMVVSRLSRRIRDLGIPNFHEYCDLLAARNGEEERAQLISCLTTNVTHFYRESGHFDDLRETVFPGLLHDAARGRRVRIWSAGCSTGQEVYSLAVTLLGLDPKAADLDVRILGTDIDPEVVSAARSGQYTPSQIDTLPISLQDCFKPAKDGSGMMEAGAELRRLVAFKILNLLRPWPMKGPFDIIMCRNVTIYFDRETQRALWQRFAQLIPPGGRLYVGHSEFRTEDAGTVFEPASAGIFIRTSAAS